MRPRASISVELPDGNLKTAFLPGQSCDVNRDVVCQLPPEAGHPPYFAAAQKKFAYGMNDAPRRWWNILHKALCSHGMVPTRVDRCCYVLSSLQSRKHAWEHWGQKAIAQQNGTKDAFTESREQAYMETAFERTLDPIAGSPATGKSVAGIINLFVDDLFGTGGNETTRFNQISKRLERCYLYRAENSLDTRFTKRAVH